ncbi:hypothetical protein PHYSODRAFT_535097 [Phytophthora sojae]|uniref:Uncharacterized protein n=1 Tax=Phytophthora sojae (strain P6497) TaxID=1094619 RepID=G5AHN3_PHYSP|nr:hypothetical protein PHYSODRAFT_535097 [Phytophthora sojae]EGZ04954.1 hypothetical protein PHYSODRAFT_535097 [Phytophthora sojae]|eukprot:XP_009539584.1 hypothetical protein PHYSODRAFT_535097 [Phytophthora sojae]
MVVRVFYDAKCYTFSSCLDGSNVGADWESIKRQAIVLYEKEQCQGKKLISHTLPKGHVMFPSDKGAKSFMAWEEEVYPTNGIEHECRRAILNMTGNSSESAGVVRLS